MKKLLLMLLLAFNVHASSEYLAVVGNESIGSTQLSSDKLYAIFLLTLPRWDNGVPVVIVMLPEDNINTQIFIENYLGLSVASYRRRTSNVYSTGRASKPIVVRSEIELMAEVNQTRGAVGYVDGTLYINDESDNLIKIEIIN